jgi:tRNA A37 methylthiotransferase MiaB
VKIVLKGLNSCTMRDAKLAQYREFFRRNGHKFVNDPAKADKVFVWGCGYRKSSLDNTIRRTSELPKEKTIMLGCAPSIKSGCGADRWSWKQEQSLNRWAYRGVSLEDCPQQLAFPPSKHPTFFCQRFPQLLISEGCNFDCAYCSEKLAFPPYRSFPFRRLFAEARKLAHHNKPLMLIGDRIGAWQDGGYRFPDLIRRLLTVVPRVSFWSLHPRHVLKYVRQFQLWLRTGKIAHIQIPIQSASNMVLKRMNRGYTLAGLAKIFKLFNDEGFTDFETHVLIGFPGETDKDFDATIGFCQTIHPRYILASHVMLSQEQEQAIGGKVPTRRVLNARVARLRKMCLEHRILCNCEGSKFDKERLEAK